MYIGVDGCPGGWLVVALSDDRKCRITVEPDIHAVWNRYGQALLILLDMPIGLKEAGTEERRCDRQARKLLGSRRSSVFPVPCLQAVYTDTYEEASRVNAEVTGRKLSRQSWAICHKIREVDAFLETHPTRQKMIREMHPEVVFWALAGGTPMTHPKRKPAGREERLEILERYFPLAHQVLDQTLDYYLYRDAAHPDILDALAGAITAYLGRRRLVTIPDPPELDWRGLPMEIVHLPLEMAHSQSLHEDG